MINSHRIEAKPGLTRTRNPDEICALCAHFNAPDFPQQAEHGLGRCTAYDQPGKLESFVSWNSTSVLFRHAPIETITTRRAFAAKQIVREEP